MARPLRIEYPGAVYHVLNRGLEQRVVFRDRVDYGSFLGVLEVLHPAFDFRIHSYNRKGGQTPFSDPFFMSG